MVDTLYIHSGYKNYLKYSLDITSKKNNIFFIGDDSNAFLRNKKNIEFINRKELLNADVENYKSYFINYSTNDESFEWSCFESNGLIVHSLLISGSSIFFSSQSLLRPSSASCACSAS